MKKDDVLKEIKDFAEKNWMLDEDDPNRIIADDDEFAVTNPWMDSSGRFPLTDEGAVKEWGLATVLDFCFKAKEKLSES